MIAFVKYSVMALTLLIVKLLLDELQGMSGLELMIAISGSMVVGIVVTESLVRAQKRTKESDKDLSDSR